MKGKRRKNSEETPRPALKEEAQGLHFRLCHLCLHLNEADEPIEKCSRCDSQLTLEFEAENEMNGVEFVNPLDEWDGEDFPDEEPKVEALAPDVDEEEEEDDEPTLSGARRRLNIRLNGLRVRW